MIYESHSTKIFKDLFWTPTHSPKLKIFRTFFYLFLALLFHLLFLTLPWDQLFTLHPFEKSLPVELTPLDSQALNKIKKAWKDKPLLLDQAHLKESAQASPDARYESARTIRVEKEQRARHTQVMPQNQKALPAQLDVTEPAPPSAPSKEAAIEKAPISLSQLGIPINFSNPQKMTPPQKKTQSRKMSSLANGGDQALLDKTLPVGAENLLNTQESKYYNFYSRIYERIGPLWQSKMHQLLRSRRYPKGTFYTQAVVSLDREGVVRDIQITRSSGISDFDELIINAWKELRQFPHPPEQIIQNERVETSWSFQIDIDNRMGWSTPPPVREY